LAFLGLGLALAVGVIQATLAWAADLFTGSPVGVGPALRSAAGFWLALAPASIASTCLVPWWGTSMAAKLVLVGTVGFSLSLSAVCSSSPDAIAAAASLLAAAGAVCTSTLIAAPVSVIRTLAPHANRHSRRHPLER
jgi:hypothetical protein